MEKLTGKKSTIDPKTIFTNKQLPPWLIGKAEQPPPGLIVEWNNPQDPFVRGKKIPIHGGVYKKFVLEPPFANPFPWQRPVNPEIPLQFDLKRPSLLQTYRTYRNLLILESPALGLSLFFFTLGMVGLIFRDQIRSTIGFPYPEDKNRDTSGIPMI